MKKIYNYLRSMKFGILLMILIAGLSAVGSVITQGESAEYYTQYYGKFSGLINYLGLDDIYKSPFFVLLLLLLCLNLILCSIVRIKNVKSSADSAISVASGIKILEQCTETEIAKVREYLKGIKCREHSLEGCTVYSGKELGRYGSFITHVGILLTVIFGAFALYLPTVSDQSCFPGEVLILDDGTGIGVSSFRIENGEGRLDFTSEIIVATTDGKNSGLQTISVNHPLSFGEYKIYQQTYGTAGSITVRDPNTGDTQDFTLNEVSFLSGDNINGVWYQAVYPDYLESPGGEITIVSNTSGSYVNPVYEIIFSDNGVHTPMLLFPGDSVATGGLEFIFNKPVEYPGLRIKHTPFLVNALLIAAFAIMTAGLYITFFMPPVLVKTDETGYTVCGPKPEYMNIKLKTIKENNP